MVSDQIPSIKSYKAQGGGDKFPMITSVISLKKDNDRDEVER